MYFFLTFIGDTMGLLRKIAPYKRSLSLNHEAMCSHLLKNHPVEVEFPETLENVNRIKNRTSSEKLSSVLLKYSVPIFEEDNKKKTNLIEYDMEFIIKILNEVEEKI